MDQLPQPDRDGQRPNDATDHEVMMLRVGLMRLYAAYDDLHNDYIALLRELKPE